MIARYHFSYRIVSTWVAILVGTMSLRATDQTISGNLSVTGNTSLQGTLEVLQGVTITGDTDLMGNIFSLGHSLNSDNSQNYGMAGLELYIKNTASTTRLIEQVTTVDGTTFKWGTKAATDLDANGILDDFGNLWMSLTSSTLTLTGNLLVNGTDNQLSAQTLTGASSVLTRGLADARYFQLAGALPLTITNTTAATSSTTGALIVSGGLGVASDSWLNGVRVGLGLGAVASNTALGNGALNANTTGASNAASGYNALHVNTTGGYNVANGYQALNANTTGSYNLASGYNAGNFQADGTTSLTDPEGSIYLGAETRGLDNNDSNSIVIAGRSATARGVGEGANTTVLGNLETTSAKIFGVLSQSGGTVTVSKPHNFTQTWNAGAVVFTGIKSNITDTASASGSLLLDLQVGGASKLSVDKAGNVAAAGALTVAGQPVLTSTSASALTITNTTAATSSTTGALIVSGGLGVAKDSWINSVRVGLGLGAVASNTALGNGALNANTTGISDTASGQNALYFNTTGHHNTATGQQALYSNTTGSINTATGYNALYSNIGGNFNTAGGSGALYSNTSGSSNTATGQNALYFNAGGNYNTASGQQALYSNTTGSWNTASGQYALYSNAGGNYNSASGQSALYFNTTGSWNTASGNNALQANTTGNNNSASGQNALYSNTTGNYNTANGSFALYTNSTGANNEASGLNALRFNTTGSYNTAGGYNAGMYQADGTTGLTITQGSIYLGAESRGLDNNDSNSIVIAGRSATARGVGEGANTTVLGNVETTSAKIFGALSQSGGTVTLSKPHNFTQTWNAGAVAFTGIKSNITDTASASGSLLMDLQVGGASRFSVDKAGNVAAAGILTVGGQPVLTTTSASPFIITNTTAATSSTTGALTVSGGLGVATDSWINGVRVGIGLGAVVSNTALGNGALNANTTGASNAASGYNALHVNTTGGYNVANGYQALNANTTGSYNLASGYNAGNFQADGITSLADPEGSVYLGAETRGFDNNDSNSIVIAGRSATARGVGEGANTTVLGNVETKSAKIFGSLSQSGGTVTVSKPHNFTQTWNAGAVVFTGIKSNITDTASASGSLVLDLQVGGASMFSVDKAGNVSTAGTLTVAGQPLLGGGSASPFLITNTTPATSSTTGALIVSGGLGVATDSWINSVRVGLGLGAVASNTALGNGALNANTTGASNAASGYNSLHSNTTGSVNTAIGYNALYSNTGGNFNTAGGSGALYSNTSGSSNTATGQNALYFNAGGNYNTASGQQALYSNTTGSWNTASGQYALYSNAGGNYNSASGQSTLYFNTTGNSNTASGYSALLSNTTGSFNTANGQNALYTNTTGAYNTASGQGALYTTSTGTNNAASGSNALRFNSTGSYNTASGSNAGMYQADGTTPLTNTQGSVYMGAETKGLDNNDSNSIVIAGRSATATGVGEGANTTVVGNVETKSAKIFGALKQSAGLAMASNPHTFTQTWGAGAVVFTGIQSNVTDNASASASLLLDLQVSGASKFSVDKAGNISTAGQLLISNPAGGIDMGEFGNPP